MPEYLTYADLFAEQRGLQFSITRRWQKGLPYVAQIGQRGGKTIVSSIMANERGKSILIISGNASSSSSLVQSVRHDVLCQTMSYGAFDQNALSNRELFSDLYYGTLFDDQTTITMDEIFWFKHTEMLFDMLSTFSVYVLALGSRGPERWRQRSRIERYATWDLNPRMSRKHPAIEKAYQNDPTKAERDFGSQLP